MSSHRALTTRIDINTVVFYDTLQVQHRGRVLRGHLGASHGLRRVACFPPTAPKQPVYGRRKALRARIRKRIPWSQALQVRIRKRVPWSQGRELHRGRRWKATCLDRGALNATGSKATGGGEHKGAQWCVIVRFPSSHTQCNFSSFSGGDLTAGPRCRFVCAASPPEKYKQT